MAQTLDQIIAGLGSVYDPQVQSVQAQQAALPQQQQNDQAVLQGQQTQAFDGILNGARRRGTGVAFGGIPLGEQAQYNATTYQPALANLYASYNTKGASLNDAINSINENRANNAQSIYQFQVGQDQAAAQLAEQQRQFDAQQRAAAAAASSGYSPSLGYNPTTSGVGGASAGPQQFIGNNDLRGHLNYLAQNGNADAKIALQYVGNDGKYNLSPSVTSPAILAALNRLGAVNTYKVQAPSKPTAATAPVGGKGTNYLGGSTTGLKLK